jgi:hypothetical protein
MTCRTSSIETRLLARRHLRSFGLLVGIVGIAGMTVVAGAPGVAQASAGPRPSAAAICHRVSASSVSAIVGFSVPPATASTDDLKPTKENDEIGAAVTSCAYGSETSLAALAKTVGLVYEVTSRTLTATELKNGLAQGQKLNINAVAYSGLGLPAFYYTFTVGGVFTQGITGVRDNNEFGAFVYSKAVSKSKLAALVRLAEKL